MSQNQGGFLDLANDIRHGKGLARTGNAEQNLRLFISSNASGETGNRFKLIAAWLEWGMQFEQGYTRAWAFCSLRISALKRPS